MPIRRFAIALLVPFLLVVAGTIGYHWIEGWPFADALYMTVITLTTVGYGETHPLSHAGRWFTILLLLGGVFSLFYAATSIIQGIVSGEIRTALGKQRKERGLAELRDHVIVCGFGRMGRYVCGEFSGRKIPFAVIERDGKLFESFRVPHGVALAGDATSEEVLKHAGIERAKALVTVLASDADNLYITMSARLLNEKIFIVSRAEAEEAESKLLRAGASRVVSPYVIGGQRLAQAVLRPAVVDFIELATRTEHLDLQIEETRIAKGSALDGATLGSCRLQEDAGVILVAVKKAAGHMVFKPATDLRLDAGDVLIALGHRERLDQLEAMAGR